MPEAGPAAQSGKIKTGDLLHAVDNTSVYQLNVEQAVSIIKGQPLSDVTLWITQPDAAAGVGATQAPQPAGVRNQIFVRGATGGLGIGFVKPDAPLGHPYVVTELTPGGPAAISGAVKPGDTILSVDGKPITQLD